MTGADRFSVNYTGHFEWQFLLHLSDCGLQGLAFW